MTPEQQIKFAKFADKLDRVSVKQAWDILKIRMNHINRIATHLYRNGDKVQFKGKYGQVVQGTVTKVMQKNISVLSDEGTHWRVRAGALTKVK